MTANDRLRGFTYGPESVRLEWDDGGSTELPSLWLRDNCAEDRDGGSGQRLIDITELPEQPRIRAVSARADALVVEWRDEPRQTSFSLAWLARHAPGRERCPPARTAAYWLEGGRLDPRLDFAWSALGPLHSDPGVRLAWLTRLVQQGLAFIRDVPVAELSILAAVAPLGLVIETNYGRVYDVRSVPQPENLAYSDRGLGLHTDNPYRDPVPGFQALHCLVASPEGGENLFADGFAIADHLRRHEPDAFATLSETAVPFHYRARDAELRAARPMIQLSTDGEIAAVHYNSRSIAPLQLPAQRLARFYPAYRRLATLLKEARFQLRVTLGAGELVLFDNHRVLHGRTGFSSARHARHLQGCYLARDSVLGQAALLERGRENGAAS